MDMIMTLSDTIAVLQEGRLIADGDPDEIRNNKAVQEAYLGGGARRG
jgi:branched-chain amino acid transport system ATP-binding protein